MYITPCISICKIDPLTQICIGCKRTLEEVRDWTSFSSQQRLEVMQRLGYGKRVGREEKLRRYEKG
jgi:predicted Fe-S protein YdhL (DUF1289 family)